MADTAEIPDEYRASTLRLPVSMRAQLAEAARLDKRSVNVLIESVLSCWLNGVLYHPMKPISATQAADDQHGDSQPAQPYYRDRGQPLKAQPGRLEHEVLDLVKRALDGLTETTPEDVAQILAGPERVPQAGFIVAVQHQMLHAGWNRAKRTSDDETVWIGPETLKAIAAS